MRNFTLVAHSCICVFWKDCGILFPQTPPIQQKVTHTWVSASTLEITQIKLLHHIYIYREVVCMYICIYVTAHIYSILWLFSFLSSTCDFLESSGGVGWKFQGTLFFTVVSCGRGKGGASVGSYKYFWRDLHSVFGHCFFLFLQLSERNINYSKLFQQINQICLGINSQL